MYVTAQHVRNETGQDGLHVFAFVHGEGHVPGVDWAAPDAGFIADEHPGQLLIAARQIEGERLAVLSYLDLAFHESLGRSAALLLRRLIATWRGSHAWPVRWNVEGIGARFYAGRAVRDSCENELVVLQDALLPILGQVVPRELGIPPGPTPTTRPLIVLKTRTDRGYQYSVEQNSRRDLESLGVPPPHTQVSVSLTNFDALEILSGKDFEEEVVPVVTKLSLEQLDALGGAEVRDTDGTSVWVSDGLARKRG